MDDQVTGCSDSALAGLIVCRNVTASMRLPSGSMTKAAYYLTRSCGRMSRRTVVRATCLQRRGIKRLDIAVLTGARRQNACRFLPPRASCRDAD